MNTAQWIVIGLAFVSTASFFYILLRQVDPYGRALHKRTLALAHATTAEATDRKTTGWWRRLDAIMPHLGNKASVQKQLSRAGYYAPGAARRYLVIRVIFLLAGACGCLVLFFSEVTQIFGVTLCIAAAIMVVAAYLPVGWVTKMGQRRHRMLRKSIPDLLELMIVCLDAGMTLPFTIKRVSEEMEIAHPGLAIELAVVQRDTAMGATLEEALTNFAARTDFDALKTLAMYTGEAQRYGTNISDALRDHAGMMINQREANAEEMAQRASVKILFPVLLLILPAIFIVVAGPAFIQLAIAFGVPDAK